MNKKLLSALLLAGGALFAQIGVGIQIGPPPPPRVIARPVAPGPGFVWVDGYWYPVGHHWRWHSGYWTPAPYAGAAWIAPRYEGGRFYDGYWQGDRGRFAHDHRWDRERDRDGHWGREHHEDEHHDRH